MKQLDSYKNYYFLGIGGIGMSALARYFKKINKRVLGYDKTQTTLTQQLESEGIAVHYTDSPELIKEELLTPENTLVIRTPAVPLDMNEWLYFQDNHFEIVKRAEVLGKISENSFCIAIGGTHGKTTTSSLVGHLLVSANKPCTFILGGILENYQSNYQSIGTEIFVVEADEFDQSFLHLTPDIACITSMDADHLDIYGEEKYVINSFKQFAKKLQPKNGVLFAQEKVKIEKNYSYSADSKTADCFASNLQIKNGYTQFDINTPFGKIKDIQFKMIGHHNIENAVVASSIALKMGLTENEIKAGLSSFSGIKRRFNQFEYKSKIYIDDYAHHPTEINAVTNAIKTYYPDKKVLGVFQPHLFSRTRDFADDFAKSLAEFDQLLLLDIYPARELPIEGITSEWLLHRIESKNKQICSLENVIEKIKSSDFDVLVTLGAGNIDSLVEPIKNWLNDE
jgi:UDP-N-acetylmuramate--alanine ligase